MLGYDTEMTCGYCDHSMLGYDTEMTCGYCDKDLRAYVFIDKTKIVNESGEVTHNYVECTCGAIYRVALKFSVEAIRRGKIERSS